MPAGPAGEKRDIAKLVERQMRNWEIARTQRETPEAEAACPEVCCFITISRAVGSGGSEVARLLAERLQWPLFDRELLQAMAGDDDVRRQLYQQMDERDTNWLEDALRWLMRGEFRRHDYFYQLSETVLAIARQGQAVFLGRGCDRILPAQRGLRVRITALRDKRAAELARRRSISEALARAEVERIDRERAEYRLGNFGKGATDPANFDVVLGLNRLTPADAVDIILKSLEQIRLRTLNSDG